MTEQEIRDIINGMNDDERRVIELMANKMAESIQTLQRAKTAIENLNQSAASMYKSCKMLTVMSIALGAACLMIVLI